MREHLPEPTIIMNVPTPISIRVRHIVRALKRFAADMLDVYKLTRPVKPHDFDKLKMAMARAAYDAATGGQTVREETFTWRARETAYGRRSKKTVERIGSARVQERGPYYHNTVRG